MTQSPAPGQSLLADTELRFAGSPLAIADSVANRIIDELGSAARLVSADFEIKRPELVAAASSRSDAGLQARAVVTAVAPGRGATLSTEVTAILGSDSGDVATLRLSLAAEAEDAATVSGLLCPGSKDWNAELHTRLNADTEFARLIETYDGTIGLSIGGRPVHLRCYRGQILEVAARSIRGADFVLDIPGEVFIDLLTSKDNTFMETAMLGRMTSSGSGYEYLRMTSALVRIVDHARGLAAAAGYAGAQATTLDNLQEV